MAGGIAAKPLKKYGDLINTYDRLEMAKLATDNSKNIAVSDVELRLPQPSYTIDTLAILKEKYPEHEFAIIMGSDNLGTLHKWKNYKLILRDYRIYVYPAPGLRKCRIRIASICDHHHDAADGAFGNIYPQIAGRKKERAVLCSRFSAGIY